MCCFSGPIEDVTNTSIFARVEGGEQFIVYEMEFTAEHDLAMVLPIPVARGSAEDAVRFINFEDYPQFFFDLYRLFPVAASATLFSDDLEAPAAEAAQLLVHSVGAFDASFVPTIADFTRLDDRFRMPERVWADLPGYKDFGFAVFKLKGGRNQRVHPMAFSFPTRDPRSLFFPTVHVHDGSVHSQARFAHKLYCQLPQAPPDWAESMPAREEVDIAKAQGIVIGHRPCYRHELYGDIENRDTYVDPFQDAA